MTSTLASTSLRRNACFRFRFCSNCLTIPFCSDFDCILTSLSLERVDKNKFRLPKEELVRTESILKRALDVEKGLSEKPDVTEEHPDGRK